MGLSSEVLKPYVGTGLVGNSNRPCIAVGAEAADNRRSASGQGHNFALGWGKMVLVSFDEESIHNCLGDKQWGHEGKMRSVTEVDGNHSQKRDHDAAMGPRRHFSLHKRVEEDISMDDMKKEGGDTLEVEFSVGMIRQQERDCIGEKDTSELQKYEEMRGDILSQNEGWASWRDESCEEVIGARGEEP